MQSNIQRCQCILSLNEKKEFFAQFAEVIDDDIQYIWIKKPTSTKLSVCNAVICSTLTEVEFRGGHLQNCVITHLAFLPPPPYASGTAPLPLPVYAFLIKRLFSVQENRKIFYL